MVLISEVLEHIGRIYGPLNLANMKCQELKFVRNTAPDNQRVLNFMRNPCCRIFLVRFIVFRVDCGKPELFSLSIARRMEV